MHDEQEKTEAVERFLDPQQRAAASGAHTEKLRAIFPEKIVAAHEPDFQKMRDIILARRAERPEGRLLRGKWQNSPLTIAALLLVAIGGLYLFRAYRTPNTEPVQTAATTRQMQPESFENSVRVFYRQGAGVTASLQDRALLIKADSIAALFSFEPTEKIKKLAIETNGITVFVVGTKFIVDSHAGKTSVLVESGTVKVRSLVKEYVLHSRETITLSAGSDTATVQKLTETTAFSRFSEPTPGPLKLSPAAPLPKSPQANAEPAITLTLKNGTTIKGYLIRENSAAVYVRVTAMGNKELSFSKEEILERQ